MTQDTEAPRGFSGPDAPDLAEAQRCVRCGLCLPHCPTYLETLRETSSPRGRIHLIQAVGEGKLDLLSPGFAQQMRQCLDCRACEAACPSGIQYGHLLENARAQIKQAEGPHRRLVRRTMPATEASASYPAGQQGPLPQKRRGGTGPELLLKSLFGDLARFRLAAALLRGYQRSGVQFAARASGALALLGLRDAEALVPPIPATFFIPRGQRYAPFTDRGKPTVAIFAGCVMSTILAPTDQALVRILTALGWPVVVPARQGCCGALLTHAGAPEAARELARRAIAAFAPSGAAYIVNTAAGCGSALKDYGHLLKDDPDWALRAQAFSARVRDASELLATDLDALRAKLNPLPLRVTYQDACHLAHAQRITAQPRDLLAAIPDLEIVELPETALCCGSAGIYNLTQPEMARRLQQRKVAHIQTTQADLVVTTNPGCYMQIRAGLRQTGSATSIMHIIDLLDASMRGLAADDVARQARG